MNKNIEDVFPFVISGVMGYIETVKNQGTSESLVDIILDYCLKKDVSIDLIGDAINSDVYFKSFIQKDCEMHKIFKTKGNKLDEW